MSEKDASFARTDAPFGEMGVPIGFMDRRVPEMAVALGDVTACMSLMA